jgi:hypothetical protein
MTRRGCACLLFLLSLAWGQAEAPPTAPKPTTASAAAGTKASISRDTAVITIPGLCDERPVDKSKAADCKTVVTRAAFEQLVETVAPTMAPRARKQLATQYGAALVMAHKAHQMGLDQGPKFEELLKVARLGVLTKELNQVLQDEAGKISDKDIEDYYHGNEVAFQEADLQRIFIPHSRPAEENKEKNGDDEARKRRQESEDALKKKAETVWSRAAGGEDFDKLEEEAFAGAELKGKPPTKLGKVRRTSLPPGQGEVMNLKPGEISQLISGPNGYVVYKVGEKDTLPLEKVRSEISSTLRSQRMQDSLQAIQQSATPELNDKYFTEAPAAALQGTAPAGGEAKPPAESPEAGPK